MRRRGDKPTAPDVFRAVREGAADVRRERMALAVRLRDHAAELREAGRLELGMDVAEAAWLVEGSAP